MTVLGGSLIGRDFAVRPQVSRSVLQKAVQGVF